MRVVILKLQSHRSYERQHELNEKGVTEADLREIERQAVIRASVLVTVPVVVLLALWLLFTDALKLFKVMRKWVAEEWDRCTGRSVDPSAPKTGAGKLLNILAFIVMILIVLLQGALALFAYWISTGPSSGGSIMGGMGAYVIGVLAERTYWIGTLGGLFLISLSGQWRYFFRTFCVCGIAFLLLLIFAPSVATLLLMGLFYEIYQITWALQHLK